MHFATESHNMEDKAVNYTLRQPIGIVGCISPWNLPLYLFTWKIAPALAAGNYVIAKPSEVTPITAFLLSKICKKYANSLCWSCFATVFALRASTQATRSRRHAQTHVFFTNFLTNRLNARKQGSRQNMPDVSFLQVSAKVSVRPVRASIYSREPTQ